MPSSIVYYSNVVEVVAGFLTRHLDHRVAIVGYSALMTWNLDEESGAFPVF